jgi:hypothetical protein
MAPVAWCFLADIGPAGCTVGWGDWVHSGTTSTFSGEDGNHVDPRNSKQPLVNGEFILGVKVHYIHKICVFGTNQFILVLNFPLEQDPKTRTWKFVGRPPKTDSTKRFRHRARVPPETITCHWADRISRT